MTFHPVVPPITSFTPPLPIADGGTNAIALPTAFNNLAASGGAMGGALALGANKITGLANGSAATDAAAFGQVPVLAGTWWQPVGFGLSNSTNAQTANLLSLMQVQIPIGGTLTGIVIENGATATGNVLVGVWNAAGSTLVASSASTAMSGTFKAQFVPFSSPVVFTAGTYIFGNMFSSSSATAAAGVLMSPSSTAAQGGFTLPSTVTPPTNAGNTNPVTICGSY